MPIMTGVACGLDGDPGGSGALLAGEVGVAAGRAERTDRIDARRGQPGDELGEPLLVDADLVGGREGKSLRPANMDFPFNGRAGASPSCMGSVDV
jgi:hypothetical protein